MDFDRFIAELTVAETELLGREQELSKQLEAVQRELRKVRDAKTCIAGKKLAKASKRAAPTKRDVTTSVESVLAERGVVEEDTLRSLVESKLVESGMSKQGHSLRFREVLRGDRFLKTPAGWQTTVDEVNQPGEQRERAS